MSCRIHFDATTYGAASAPAYAVARADETAIEAVARAVARKSGGHSPGAQFAHWDGDDAVYRVPVGAASRYGFRETGFALVRLTEG